MNIDTEKTRNYYKDNVYCNCSHCRNFYIQFKDKFNDIYNYLSSLGVNPLRPFELMPINYDDGTTRYVCQYVLYGKCDQNIIATIDNIELALCADNHHPQTHIDEDHFVIEFGPIVLENYTIKIDELIKRIDECNHVNYKKDFSLFIEKFYSIIEYVDSIQQLGLIEADGINITKEYLETIFESDKGNEIRFKDLLTNNIYEIRIYPRANPGIRILNQNNKKSFLDLIRYEKSVMNPIRFKINYIYIPIYMVVFFINIILIIAIDINNDNLSLISYILLGMDILSLPIVLSLLPLIRKTEVNLELDKYDFVESNGNLIYEFDDKSGACTRNVIEFKEDKIIINKKQFDYENCSVMVVTSNYLLRININVFFEISNEDGYEFNIPIKLDGSLIKMIKERNIKVLNKETYEYIINNKEKAFYQIIKYGHIRKK